MKTPEEKKAEREARLIATITAPRTGYTPETTEQPAAPPAALQGLKLSLVDFWPLDRFKPHPSNHVFDSAKTDTYWRDLRRDILEAGAIINPVITLPDGTLLEGHSRIRIARELAAEGKNLGPIPVRVVASPITPEEAERRVYLGNLSRFELDDDTRLNLYRKIWPGYFLAANPGHPRGGDTVSPPPTKSEIAAATGKSPRQVQRDRQVVRNAVQIAKKKGKPDADDEDIREARKKAASRRKVPVKASGRVTLSRAHAAVVLDHLRRARRSGGAHEKTVVESIIKILEKALGR